MDPSKDIDQVEGIIQQSDDQRCPFERSINCNVRCKRMLVDQFFNRKRSFHFCSILEARIFTSTDRSVFGSVVMQPLKKFVRLRTSRTLKRRTSSIPWSFIESDLWR